MPITAPDLVVGERADCCNPWPGNVTSCAIPPAADVTRSGQPVAHATIALTWRRCPRNSAMSKARTSFRTRLGSLVRTTPEVNVITATEQPSEAGGRRGTGRARRGRAGRGGSEIPVRRWSEVPCVPPEGGARPRAGLRRSAQYDRPGLRPVPIWISLRSGHAQTRRGRSRPGRPRNGRRTCRSPRAVSGCRLRLAGWLASPAQVRTLDLPPPAQTALDQQQRGPARYRH